MNSTCMIFALILGLSFGVIAKDKIDRRENTDKFKKYKTRIEEQISELPSLTHCDDKVSDQELLECVEKSLGSLPQVDIDKIEQVMELKTHRLIKSKKKQNVVSYLMTELEKKIHESSSDKIKRKDKKYLSQADYFTLHKNRLTKSTLLETASFCRERVVISDNCLKSGCDVGVPKNDDDTYNQSIIYISIKNESKKNDETDRLNQAGRNSTLAADFHIMCMSKIKDLCNIYVGDRSQEDFAEACLFKDRMAKFQKTINATAKIESELLQQNSERGFTIESAYSGRFDRSNVDKLTNITSDFSNNKKIQDMAVDTEQVKKDCEAGKKTDQCNQYVDVMSQEELKGIEYELRKKDAIQNVMLDQLDDDKLEEFAKKYISEKDIIPDQIRDQLKAEFKAKRDAIIADIKKQVHGAEDKASPTAAAANDPSVVKTEKDEKKFEFRTNAEVANVVKEIEEESNPNALRDNIFYSNLVNSYLQRTNETTKQDSSNFAFGEAEFANDKNLVKNDKDTYFQQRKNAKSFFEKQKKESASRGVASTEEGDLGGLGDIFKLIIFGTKK